MKVAAGAEQAPMAAAPGVADLEAVVPAELAGAQELPAVAAPGVAAPVASAPGVADLGAVAPVELVGVQGLPAVAVQAVAPRAIVLPHLAPANLGLAADLVGQEEVVPVVRAALQARVECGEGLAAGALLLAAQTLRVGQDRAQAEFQVVLQAVRGAVVGPGKAPVAVLRVKAPEVEAGEHQDQGPAARLHPEAVAGAVRGVALVQA